MSDVVTTLTRHIYDNEDILLELDGSNNITARYTHGPGIDEPLIMEKAGVSFFYHADGLGSITEITDTTGVVKQRYTYSSFGKIESQLDPNFIQPYTFTAREFDPETGLYHYRKRDLDPNTGRFNQEDPLNFYSGDLNLYAYVGNNPVRTTDPSGLLAFPWHFGITFVGALNSGYGIAESFRLGWNVAAVDFTSGSQGTSAEVTAQYAMAGILPDGSRQTSAEAIAATNAYIQASITSGNLAGALHAAQDLATPGHDGQPWRGFGLNWATVKHLFGDTFPSFSTIKQAYQNTRNILNRSAEGCPQ